MEHAGGSSVRLPARATRGQRLNKLIEDEDEADKAFWGQDAFNEEDQEEYVSEEEEQDVFDSDFDDDEDMEVDGDEDEDERPRKRRKPPPGAAPKRPSRKAATAAMSALTPKGQDKSFEAVFQDRMAGAGAEKKAAKPKSATVKRPRVEEEPEWAEVGVERRSKRAVVVERERERAVEAEEAWERAKTKKPVAKKKPVVEERRLTQEEMLAEAAQTEIANLQSLEIMLAREEEIKRKAIIHKEAFAGPQIRYHSKGGHTVLEFTRVDAFPSVIHATAPPYTPKSLCAVTGLPAKYKDPLSGLPYATLEAFKVLRERWNDRGKRIRPLSSIGDRRAKPEATDNLLGFALGSNRKTQKSARDSPAPGKRRSRPSLRASPRDSQSPGASSPEERSPGPASPAELPLSRLGMQSGATQSDPEQLASTPVLQQLPSLRTEQPLPSLHDVTFDDFDVGMVTQNASEAPVTSAAPPASEAPANFACHVAKVAAAGSALTGAAQAAYDVSASRPSPGASEQLGRESESGPIGGHARDALSIGGAIEVIATEGQPLETDHSAGMKGYGNGTEGSLKQVTNRKAAGDQMPIETLVLRT